MAWIQIDDHYDEHPKHAAAGPLGQALWLAGLAYCNRNLTDGFIPWSTARRLLSWEYLGPDDGNERGRKVYHIGASCGMHGEDVTCELVINILLDVELWEEVDGGYQVHDYKDWQKSKDEILELRAKKVAAGQAGGQASAKARAQSKRKQNPTPQPQPQPIKKTNAAAFVKESTPQQINATYEHTLNGHFDKVADRFARIDQQYTAGWLRSTLLYCEAQVGPLPLPQLGKGIELTIDQLQRAKADDKIRSPRAFARKVMIDYLTEQKDEHHAA